MGRVIDAPLAPLCCTLIPISLSLSLSLSLFLSACSSKSFEDISLSDREKYMCTCHTDVVFLLHACMYVCMRQVRLGQQLGWSASAGK